MRWQQRRNGKKRKSRNGCVQLEIVRRDLPGINVEADGVVREAHTVLVILN